MSLPPGYDRRLTAANDRVADTALKGQIDAPRYVTPTPATVAQPVTDLLRAPGGPRDRQLLTGWDVDVFDRHDGYAFVRSHRDGYVGYVAEGALAPPCDQTHRVSARSTHAYSSPDMKSAETCTLSYGAQVRMLSQTDKFIETPLGHIPRPHLSPIDAPEPDPVAIAERLVGTPYLWGGNSAFGIDCSGLVQAALLGCGIPCPGDSDLQEQTLGASIPADAPLNRSDLIFWKGHVAMVVDHQRLIHANAHHMAVAYEPIKETIARIKAQGDGPVASVKRLRS